MLSLAGVLLGRRVGAHHGAPAEIAGGVILIVIGTRVVLDAGVLQHRLLARHPTFWSSSPVGGNGFRSRRSW